MEGRNRISNEQIKALLITSIVGVGILSLPSDVATELNTGGWIAIILGGLLIVPFIIIINKTFELYPGKSIFQIGEEITNPMLFRFFLVFVVIYVMILLGYSIRIFAEVIKAYLLETTPIEVIIIAMLIAMSYIARSQIEVVSRVAVMIYPIIIGYIIFLILVNIPNTDFSNIHPVLDIDYRQLPKGIFSTLFAYGGYEIIFLSMPLSEDRDKMLSYSLRGLFTVMGIYLIVFFITLSQYGIFQLKREIWPSIAVVKEVDLPGYFLENLDGIAMAAWVMVVYGTTGPFLYGAGMVLSNILKTKDHGMFILFLLPIIYVIALLPENLAQVKEVMGPLLEYFALVIIFIAPLILFILAYIKRRREGA